MAPSPVPFTMGGTERAVTGIVRAVNEHTPHSAELLKLPVREHTFGGLIAGYRAFAELDVSHFDLVITTKYPAWMIDHPNHTCYLFHPLRGLYDTYDRSAAPVPPRPPHPVAGALASAASRTRTRTAALDLLAQCDAALGELGADHPDLALVSPTSREVVHALDRVARGRPGVRRHLALSQTVASRSGYFPAGVRPEVVYLPPDLAGLGPGGARHFFTMSRFDRPKRLHLVVEAMRRTTTDRPLLLAGSGPEEGELRRLAGGDPRIRFLGRIDDAEAAALYRDALAVPFVPDDEDYGLITVEAMACATPVITCTDSGGPTEFVDQDVTGLVVAPEPAALAAAMGRLARDEPFARRLGEQAHERTAALTWPATARALVGTTAAHGPAGLATRGATPAAPADGRRPDHEQLTVLSTYAIYPALHGGQVRCAELYGRLTDRFDLHFLCLGPYEGEATEQVVAPGIRQSVLPMTRRQAELCWTQEPLVGVPLNDVLGGSSIGANPPFLAALRTSLDDAAAVVLAHPYLLPALEEYGSALPLAFDAHNVEFDLKASMYPSSALGRELLDAVDRVERAAVERAALVTACSAEDAARLAERAERPVADIHVISNGARVPPTIASAHQRAGATRTWLRRFDRPGRTHEGIAVFLASFHGPNVDAARLICEIAPDVPEALFVLGGGHGEALRRRPLPSNVVVTGMLAPRAKDAVLAAASVALNPMRLGSGTNLKVLEYLAAGVPVVSTPFGVRGLGAVDGEHLLLAEPADLAASVRRVLRDPDASHRRAVAGHAFVAERYDWTGLAARYAELLAHLLGAEVAQKRASYSAEL